MSAQPAKSPLLLRLLRGTAIIALCATTAVGIGGYAFFKRAEPMTSGQVSLPHLVAKAEVFHDGYGIPHIFAGNAADAARILGYMHASERMFQMEMQRRAGQGRLAEVVGRDMLPIDQYTRTLGVYHLAESSFQALSPEAQAIFTAYADGVNAWLDQNRSKLAPEFKLLGITPDAWQPADSVVWGKLMALQLSQNKAREVLRARLAQHMPDENWKKLFPLAPSDAPVTMAPRSNQPIPTPVHAPTGSGPATTPATPKADQHTDLAPPSNAAHLLGEFLGLDHAASNEWVVAGSRTTTGKPILANDPHLGLEAPIMWYLAAITTPDNNVRGASVPGLPLILLGQNDHIAWGFTTTNSDVQDLFIETIDPKNPDNYLTPTGSQAFEKREEVIHVKGEPDVTLNVRTTRHGAVISDIDPEIAQLAGKDKVMALAFTGAGAQDTTSEALLRLNSATDWPSFRTALKLFQTPPQNIVFADRAGNIGFINPGLVPVRKKGDGSMPVDGASGAYDWQGTVPFDQVPQLYNPASGFVFNANNTVTNQGVTPYWYGQEWEEPYRARRLQALFDETPLHSLDSSAKMQADIVSMAAHDLLPFITKLKGKSPAEDKALEMLRAWNGAMDKNKPEPAIFEAWLYEMHKAIAEKAGTDISEKGPYTATAIAAILDSNDTFWCGTTGCQQLIQSSFTAGLNLLHERQGSNIEKWQWGQEHVTLLTHKVFSHVPLLKNASNLSVSSSGDYYSLNRGGSFSAPADQPFTRKHGGGYRAIYDLADPTQSRFMIATGESGHIFSPHYGDMVEAWNSGGYITISGTRDEFLKADLPKLEFSGLTTP